ncbi:MKL [Mytilus coruscus]|uniref:MKL n=1 Tax=Mytilus coruscus TaxID=42192 RepID=A0A6J8ENX7_MYTCO|nr:MKL [Mytilus coruscus]
MADVYVLWPIPKLKNELTRRGATTTGRKTDLIERLRAYDRNANFRGVPVNLPEPLDPQWPLTGFQQLRSEHKIMLPKLTAEQIEGYFLYRMAEDLQARSPVKTQSIPSKRKHLDSILDDPRPAKFHNLKGYNDHVRNSLINFCSTTSMDISLRYIYPKADLQNAVHDHDYLERPFAEY